MRRDFEAEKRHWRHEVGRAIFAMGELEHLVVEIVVRLCQVRIPATVLEMTMRQRLKLLGELIDHHGGQHEQRLREFAARVADLSGKRNVVAHNPLFFVLGEGATSDDFRVCSLRGKDMDLQSVSKLADDAIAAASDVQTVIHALRANRL